MARHALGPVAALELAREIIDKLVELDLMLPQEAEDILTDGDTIEEFARWLEGRIE